MRIWRIGIRFLGRFQDFLKRGATTITYEYDFGDKWQIELTAEPMDEGYHTSRLPNALGDLGMGQ